MEPQLSGFGSQACVISALWDVEPAAAATVGRGAGAWTGADAAIGRSAYLHEIEIAMDRAGGAAAATGAAAADGSGAAAGTGAGGGPPSVWSHHYLLRRTVTVVSCRHNSHT